MSDGKYKRSDFKWLDDVHRIPNPYLSESGDFLIQSPDGDVFDCYSPKFRLNGDLVKRWHSHRVVFDPIFVDGYGWIDVPAIDYFSLHDRSYESGEAWFQQTFVLPESTTGAYKYKESVVILDLHRMTLIIRSGSDSYVHYDIDRFEPVGSDIDPETRQLTIRNRIVLERFSDGIASDDFMTMYYHQSRVEDVNIHKIMMGAVNEVCYDHKGDTFRLDDNILPWYPVNLSHISSLTGISVSSLSDIRKGRTKLENMSISTSKVLTQYGNIRFLDANMHRWFMQSTSNVGSKPKDSLSINHRKDAETTVYSYAIYLKSGAVLRPEYKERSMMQASYDRVHTAFMGFNDSDILEQSGSNIITLTNDLDDCSHVILVEQISALSHEADRGDQG